MFGDTRSTVVGTTVQSIPTEEVAPLPRYAQVATSWCHCLHWPGAVAGREGEKRPEDDGPRGRRKDSDSDSVERRVEMGPIQGRLRGVGLT